MLISDLEISKFKYELSLPGHKGVKKTWIKDCRK